MTTLLPNLFVMSLLTISLHVIQESESFILYPYRGRMPSLTTTSTFSSTSTIQVQPTHAITRKPEPPTETTVATEVKSFDDVNPESEPENDKDHLRKMRYYSEDAAFWNGGVSIWGEKSDAVSRIIGTRVVGTDEQLEQFLKEHEFSWNRISGLWGKK